MGSLRGEDIPLGSRIIKLLKEFYACLNRGMDRSQAMHAIERRTGAFDPYLVALLTEREKKHASLSPPSTNPHIQTLPVYELLPGFMIVEDVKLNNGGVLLSAGNWVTPPIQQRLVNFHKMGRIPLKLRVNTNPGYKRSIV